MKIFGCTSIQNQEKYRPTYNAGPMKYLPVAYMKAKVMSKEEALELEKAQQRDEEEVKQTGFIPNFDDSEDEESKEASPKIGQKRKLEQVENDQPKSSKDIKSSKEINENSGMKIEVMRWGMTRPDDSQLVINGRFEDLLKRPMFRDLLKDFRCIVTINGYYEWRNPGEKDKQPFYIYPKNGEYLELAALYRPQVNQDGSITNTFVVLTLEAIDSLSFIHHRMPVLLTEETRKIWLDPDIDFRHVYRKIYEELPTDMLSYYKVADVVNSIKNDNEDCIMELEKYKAKLHSRGLGRFFSAASKKPEESKQQVMPEKKSEPPVETQASTNNTAAASVIQTAVEEQDVVKSQQVCKDSEEAKEPATQPSKPEKEQGIPLRLRPGREGQKKSKKYMTSYELRQQAENKERKTKRMKKTDTESQTLLQNLKLDKK